MISILYATLCVVCLCIGFFSGYNINHVKKIEIKSPIAEVKKKMETHKNEKEQEERMQQFNAILENIENYDGTGNNQKELKNIEI